MSAHRRRSDDIGSTNKWKVFDDTPTVYQDDDDDDGKGRGGGSGGSSGGGRGGGSGGGRGGRGDGRGGGSGGGSGGGRGDGRGGDEGKVNSANGEEEHRRSTSTSSENSRSGDGRSIFRSARTPRGVKSSPMDFSGTEGREEEVSVLPSVRRISEFIDYVFSKAQLEIDGLIIAFIYLERLLERASRDGINLLYGGNWRTICFISLVLASKIWDDFSMDNADFSIVWKPTTVKRVNQVRWILLFVGCCLFVANLSFFSFIHLSSFPPPSHPATIPLRQLERKVLEFLRYNVSIPASDYAACYFKLRSLVTSLGLKEDELQMVTGALRPLSSTEAYKLEALSETYQRHVGDSIQRQLTSGLSTPLQDPSNRRSVMDSGGRMAATPVPSGVRRAKSGRRLTNQDKSKSFTAGGLRGANDFADEGDRRAAHASVEHMMFAASTKRGGSGGNDDRGGFGGSRQPWKQSGGGGDGGGSKTKDR